MTRTVGMLALFCALSAGLVRDARAEPVTVGSKQFTESVILGEIATTLLRDAGVTARHRAGLGGTRILWQALLRGEIDAYPEYTGTIRRELFAGRALADVEALRAALAEEGVRMTAPLGFENTYALGLRRETANQLGLETISDLAAHPELRLGFSNEFMDRADGWPALRRAYGLPHRGVRGLDHDLAYRGLAAGDIDVIDVYTTDAEIAYYDLALLRDDHGHFPAYDAVILYRADLAARAGGAPRALRKLEGRIDAAAMSALNAEVKIERASETRAAAGFLRQAFGIETERNEAGLGARLLTTTADHLVLVVISLSAAILVAIPLGIAAARHARLGQAVLAATGVIQTIPALALLVFMIPLLGIGGPPAVAALFLYSLLPVVRNTHAGLVGIAPALAESARALGLPPGARLRLVELPLAAPSILAGIKTSAVINVGTATLGALIGAGGYGQPILTGIRLDDIGLILEGAVPAALLALAVQGGFETMERMLVPKGLRTGAVNPSS
jgi:osmoprotectant transport system permease protein